MVEEDAVGRVKAVRLTVVDRRPERIELCYCVRRTRVERRLLILRHLERLSEELGRRCLIETRLRHDLSNRLQQTDGAEPRHISGIGGHGERDADVRLGGEIVDLIRLNLGQDGGQRLGITEVTVVETQVAVAERALAEMVDAAPVEGRGPPHHPVDLIAFVEQKLREVGAVLAGDAGDQGFFHRAEFSRGAERQWAMGYGL